MGMRGLQRASGLKSKGAVRVCEVETHAQPVGGAAAAAAVGAQQAVAQAVRDSDQYFQRMLRQGGNAVIKSPESPRTPTKGGVTVTVTPCPCDFVTEGGSGRQSVM